MGKIALIILSTLALLSCDKNEQDAGEFKWSKVNPPELGSTPYPMDSQPILFKNARIMTAAGKTIERGQIFTSEGLIKGISESDIVVPENTQVIDAKGMTITPGIVDPHSHIGLFPAPFMRITVEGNEMHRPFTSDVWAEHGFNPQDPMLWRALASGVTTFQVLHGSANLVGGRSFIAKLIPHTSARQMRFFGAKQGVKLACGENVKRRGPSKGNFGNTRMGNMAGWRQVFQQAIEYKREWDTYNKKKEGKVPKRDFMLETLAKVLEGEILVHWHCYRADDINNILDVAQEFGFKIRTIHHGLEAYKVRKRLAKEDIATATWADWWGFKQEAYDGIPQNAALLYDAGARPIIHSDSEVDIRYLNLETAKAMMAGRKVGINVAPEEALKWITINSAWALGLDDKIGSIEKGKMADLVVWDGHPFSVYTKTKYVLVNGKIVFDREKELRPISDYEVGTRDPNLFDGRDFSSPPVKEKMNFTASDSINKDYGEDFIMTNVTVFDGERILSESQNVKFEKQRASLISTLDVEKSSLKKIDGTGKFITPGFIEVSSWLGLVDILANSETHDKFGRSHKPTPDNYAADAIDPYGIRIPVVREEGITTVIAHPDGKLIGGFGAAYDLDPAYTNVNPKALLKSYLAKTFVGEKNTPASRSIIWRQLRSILADAKDTKAGRYPYAQGQSSPFNLSKKDFTAMTPVVAGQVPWMMNLYRASNIETLLDFYKNNSSIKPVIQGGQEAWVVAKKLAKNKIPVVLRPTWQTPSKWSQAKARLDQAAFLNNAGVDVIISTNSGMLNKRTRQEAGIAVRHGMKKAEALKAITSTPARVFKLTGKGSLKSGDIVIWSGDPLEPTSTAEQIRIGGRIQSLETRQKQLAKKYLKQSD